MGGFKVSEVFVVKDFKENAIGVPGCAAANKFSIRGAKGVEDGVVEFLVVGNKVEFISIDHMKRWASDCVGVVGESFYAASVGEVKLCFLRFIGNTSWEFMGEGGYALQDAFGLSV